MSIAPFSVSCASRSDVIDRPKCCSPITGSSTTLLYFVPSLRREGATVSRSVQYDVQGAAAAYGGVAALTASGVKQILGRRRGAAASRVSIATGGGILSWAVRRVAAGVGCRCGSTRPRPKLRVASILWAEGVGRRFAISVAVFRRVLEKPSLEMMPTPRNFVCKSNITCRRSRPGAQCMPQGPEKHGHFSFSVW